MNLATQLRNAHRKNDIETIVELCADPSIDEIEPSLRHRVLFWALAYHLNKRKREGTVCVALGGEKCPEHDCKKLDEIAGKIITAVKTIEHFDPSLDDDVKSNLSNMYVLAWRLYTCEWFQVLYKNWPGATWSHRLAYTHNARCLTIARAGTVMARTPLLPEKLPCPKSLRPTTRSLTA